MNALSKTQYPNRDALPNPIAIEAILALRITRSFDIEDVTEIPILSSTSLQFENEKNIVA
ncbi:hypothetical protein [Vibrio owensii]|uniref:hypothetical protein n=1 Tax=Vibrio owensii TaxID=696485 RepID=UPI0005F08691|nr:hypothetical protein [Vibrio owensii]